MREVIQCKSIPVTESGCWLWDGPTFNHGRPRVWKDNTHKLAHRVSYEAFLGDIPDGTCVCHKCDTPLCVNPDHLFLGTWDDNNKDKTRKGRQAFLRGESHGSSRLTAAQVSEIRRIHSIDGVPTEKIGTMFGVSGRHIRHIVNRKLWRHDRSEK